MAIFSFIFLDGYDENTHENMLECYEIPSLKFPQAKECLAEIEDNLILFLASRSEEIHFENLYTNKFEHPITKGKAWYYF